MGKKPGSYCCEIRISFLELKVLKTFYEDRIRDLVNPGSGIRGWKKSDPGTNISDPQHWFHFKLPVLLFKLVQVVIEPVLPTTARLHSRVPVGQEFFFEKKEFTFREEKRKKRAELNRKESRKEEREKNKDKTK
jgi:hypothetical protein